MRIAAHFSATLGKCPNSSPRALPWADMERAVGAGTGGAGGEFGDEGFEKVRGGGAGGDEVRFQLVHQAHQLIHLGHDPALFGEGWNWNCEVLQELRLQLTSSVSRAIDRGENIGLEGSKCDEQIILGFGLERQQRLHVLVDGDCSGCHGDRERSCENHASDNHEQASRWDHANRRSFHCRLGDVVLRVPNMQHLHVLGAHPRNIPGPKIEP